MFYQGFHSTAIKTFESVQDCVVKIRMVMFQCSKRASRAQLWRSVDTLMGRGRLPTTDPIRPNGLHAFCIRKLPPSKQPQFTLVRGTSGYALAIMNFRLPQCTIQVYFIFSKSKTRIEPVKCFTYPNYTS